MDFIRYKVLKYFEYILLRLNKLKIGNRNIIKSLLLALIIECVLLIGNITQLEFVTSTQRWGIDKLNKIYVESCSYFKGKTLADIFRCDYGENFHFINITDHNYKDSRWGGGYPEVVPRVPLNKAINKAFQLGADTVIVDIDLSNRIGNTEKKDQILSENAIKAFIDQENKLFANNLIELLGSTYFDEKRKLILVSHFDYINSNKQQEDISSISELEYKLFPLWEINDVINQSNHKIQLASPYFDVSQYKNVNEWQLFQLYCENNQVKVMPSVQLLTFLNKYHINPPLKLDIDCTYDVKLSKSIYWKKLQKIFESQGIRMPDFPHSGEIGNRILYHYNNKFHSTDILNFINYSKLSLNGKIVIIGGSWETSNDFFDTPLGKLSGSVLLLNSISSMHNYGLFEEVNYIIIHMLSFLFIILVSLCDLFYKNYWVAFFIKWGVFITLCISSFFLFSKGIWFDFVLPFLAMQLYKNWLDIKEYLAKLKNLFLQ